MITPITVTGDASGVATGLDQKWSQAESCSTSPSVLPTHGYRPVVLRQRATNHKPIPINEGFKLTWWDDLDRRSEVEWDVKPIIPRGGLVVVYGPPGTGKTFLGLDLAYAVATGREWHGHEVRQGSVVYVYAESAAGLPARIDALEARYPTKERVPIAFLPHSNLDLLNTAGSVVPFAESIAGQLSEAPSLIVIDTLSRNAPGCDENTQKDMSRLVSACDYLRTRFGCTVLLIHHTRKGDNEIRGNSVLTGAVDTSILVTKSGKTLTLTCKKQRSAEEFMQTNFRLVEVAGSLVLEQAISGIVGPELDHHVRMILERLASQPQGLTAKKWAALVTSDGSMSERTFYVACRRATEEGYVVKPSKRGRYTLTVKGRELLQLQTSCKHAAVQQTTLTATTAGGYVIPPGCSEGEK